MCLDSGEAGCYSWTIALRAGRSRADRQGRAMYAKPSRVATRVISVSGDVRELDVFLGPALHRHYETETLGERLNSQGLQFLPVADGEKVELWQIDHIAEVQLEGSTVDLSRLESIGASRHSVTVHLSTGDTLKGDLVSVMPKERPRVSDVLNSSAQQFLLLVEPGRCHYVNRKAVVRVEA